MATGAGLRAWIGSAAIALAACGMNDAAPPGDDAGAGDLQFIDIATRADDATAPDLTSAPDLPAPADLTVPPDQATPPDLTAISVTLAPSLVRLPVNATQQLLARVGPPGVSQAVTWTVQGVGCGAVDAGGLY